MTSSVAPLLAFVGALVPDRDVPGAVFAGGDGPGEGAVLERMVLDMDCEVVLGGGRGNALRECPRDQDTVPLEAEVPVEARRVVLLDHEGGECGRGGAPTDGRRLLRCCLLRRRLLRRRLLRGCPPRCHLLRFRRLLPHRRTRRSLPRSSLRGALRRPQSAGGRHRLGGARRVTLAPVLAERLVGHPPSITQSAGRSPGVDRAGRSCGVGSCGVQPPPSPGSADRAPPATAYFWM